MPSDSRPQMASPRRIRQRRAPGKYRDQESTMDWFEVRHLSGAQGRFQSVDPGNAGANAADPQTWNAYAYVGNNPLSSNDPSGMFAEAGGDGSWGGFFVAGGLAFRARRPFASLTTLRVSSEGINLQEPCEA
jgi:RHS repeat-associated protein